MLATEEWLAPSERAKVDRRVRTEVWPLVQWAFRETRADGADAAPRLGWSGSATASVCRTLELGAIVDGGGWRTGGASCSDDAWEVMQYVHDLDVDEHEAIWRAACARQAPDWGQHVPGCVMAPVLGRDGRPRLKRKTRRGEWVFAPGDARTAVGHGLVCAVEMQGVHPDIADGLVSVQREHYAVWWRGLRILELALAAAQPLERWFVHGIGAAREPWMQNAS